MEVSEAARASWRSRFRSSRLHLGICVLLTLISFGQQPGRTTFDTKFDLTADPLRMLARSFTLWDTSVDFGGLANQGYGYLFPQGTFFALGQLAAVPDWIVQRAWSALVLLIAYDGARRLAKALGIGSSVIPIVVGLGYALSPRIIGLSGSLTAEIVPSAVLPWICLPIVLVLTGRMSARRGALLAALGVVAMGGVNATENLLALPLPLLLVCSGLGSVVGRRLAVWWVATTTLASLWWMLPLLLLGRYSPPFLDYIETASTTTRTSGWSASLRGAEHWLGYIVVGPEQWWPVAHAIGSAPILVVLGGLVAGLGLGGLVLRSTPFRVALVLSLMVGLIVTTTGHGGPAGSPIASDIRSLLDGGLAPFRNIHKADPLIRLPLALGLGAACLALGAYAQRRRHFSAPTQRWAALAAVALVLGSVAPVVADSLRHPGWDDVPTAWTQAADWIDRDGPGTTLVLPAVGIAQQTWGWTVDEPIQGLASSAWATRSQIPLVPSSTIRFLDGIEGRLAEGIGSTRLAATLAASGVTRILVRNDLDVGESDTAEPARVAAALARSPGLTEVAGFGGTPGGLRSIQVYRVSGSDGTPALVNRSAVPLLTGAPEDVIAAREAGLLGATDHAVVGRAAKGSAPDIVADGYRLVERQFGRFHDATGQVMTRTEPGRTGRRVADFLGVSGVPRTYADFTDVRTVTATSSAGYADALGAILPELGPASVLDGDASTYWRSAPYERAVGQAIHVTLKKPHPIGQVAVLLGIDGASGARVTRVRIQAGSEHRDVPVAADGSARVDFARRVVADRVGVTVLALGSHRSDAAVAIRDLTIEGITSTRRLVVPDVGASAATSFLFTTQPPRRACFASPFGTSCDPSLVRPGVEQLHLGRTFTEHGAGTWSLGGTAVALSSPSAARLLLPLGKALAATSSSVLGDDPGVSAMLAVDGQPDTSWLAAAGDLAPVVDLSWNTPRTISRIQVVASVIPSLQPYQVDIEAGGQHRTVGVGANGLGFFTPITASSARITLHARADGRGQHLSVGVGELRLTGLEGLARPVATRAGFTSICGLGPQVQLGGRPYRTTISGTLDDVVHDRPLTWKSCDGPVSLSAGTWNLDVGATGTFSATTAVLTTNDPRPVGVEPSRTVTSSTAVAPSMRIKVGSGAESVLVFGQNTNAGWQAELNGQPLVAQTLDGWQQGFVVPAGPGGTVAISFAPSTTYRLALGVGAAGIVALLVLLLLDVRRPAPLLLPDPTSVRRRARTAGLLVGAVLLAVLGGPVVAVTALGSAIVARSLGARAGQHVVAVLAAVVAVAGAVVAAASSGTAAGAPGTAADLVTAVACGLVFGTLAVRGEEQTSGA